MSGLPLTYTPPMLDADITRRLELALHLAQAGGRQTLGRFQTGPLAVETKRDGTAVTEADRACERFLRDGIGSAFPDDAILGEEYGLSAGASGFRWILDPIDGTTSFIHGVPLFGTLVAVEHGGQAVAGVIHMPALDETVYAARGHGAWHTFRGCAPAPARVSGVDRLSHAMVVTTSLDYFEASGTSATWTTVRRSAGATRGWSDCYAFLLVATGRADAAVEPVVKVWDIAPMQPILAEAGGVLTDWRGNPDLSAPMCLASNGRIHNELLEILSHT
jgi:histidinol-phosphatase